MTHFVFELQLWKLNRDRIKPVSNEANLFVISRAELGVFCSFAWALRGRSYCFASKFFIFLLILPAKGSSPDFLTPHRQGGSQAKLSRPLTQTGIKLGKFFKLVRWSIVSLDCWLMLMTAVENSCVQTVALLVMLLISIVADLNFGIVVPEKFLNLRLAVCESTLCNGFRSPIKNSWCLRSPGLRKPVGIRACWCPANSHLEMARL